MVVGERPHLFFCQVCHGAARHWLLHEMHEGRHPILPWVMHRLKLRQRTAESHGTVPVWTGIGAPGVRKSTAKSQTQAIREAVGNRSVCELGTHSPGI